MGNICLLLYMGILSIFDWREKRVPLVLLAAGLIAASVYAFYSCLGRSENLAEVIIQMCFDIIPGVFLVVMARLTKKIGWGDGTVLVILGLAEGLQKCMALFCFSILLMALTCIVLLLLHKVKKQTALPYLPFLTVVYLAGFLV